MAEGLRRNHRLVLHFRERVTIKPSVGFYNLPNFANFDNPSSMMSGLLTGSPAASTAPTTLGNW